MAFVYSDACNITSGALYHRVTTYLIEIRGILYSVLFSSSISKPLANPKSHIFKSQFLLTNILLGFKSLCITLAEWM